MLGLFWLRLDRWDILLGNPCLNPAGGSSGHVTCSFESLHGHKKVNYCHYYDITKVGSDINDLLDTETFVCFIYSLNNNVRQYKYSFTGLPNKNKYHFFVSHFYIYLSYVTCI